MKFIAGKEQLLDSLQFVCSVVERRQTTPILSHLLLVAEDNRMVLTGTDQEMELVATINDIDVLEPGEITIPARKFLDICLSLPETARITAELSNNRIRIKSSQFRSHLVTMPAADFPNIKDSDYDTRLTLSASVLSRMLRSTAFAMAQQDVRYFYNGVLLDIQETRIRLVATNSHKLATTCTEYESAIGARQAIIPRKAVGELMRLISDADDSEVDLQLSASQMQVDYGQARLITKLIDATYPDYTRAIPEGEDRVILADRETLKTALTRIAILSNELNHVVRLSFAPGKLEMYANNSLQEEAEETLEIEYDGPPLAMQFNVNYLIEILSVILGDTVKLTIRDIARACLLEDAADSQSLFLITPVK